MGDKAAGVDDNLLQMLSQQQLVGYAVPASTMAQSLSYMIPAVDVPLEESMQNVP